MLAKLFGFTRAFLWSLVVGFVTLGSWVTAQHIEPNDVPPPIEKSLDASAESSYFEYSPPNTAGRDSLFVIESESIPAESAVRSSPEETPIHLVANEVAADAAASDLHVAPPELAVYNEPQARSIGDCTTTFTDSLERAAQAGCRLFETLSDRSGGKVVQVSDVSQLAKQTPIKTPAAAERDSRFDLVATAPGVLPAAEWPSATQEQTRNNPCRACRNDTTADHSAETTEIEEIPAKKTAVPARTQTCRLKNRRTNEPMATLAISSSSTSQLTPEELDLAQRHHQHGISPGDVTPRLEVSQNEYTQAWQIDARNIELPQLLEQLSHYCAFPIVCGQNVTGTVSATVSAHSMDELLYRLVRPFGFKISRDGATLVVGMPYHTGDVYADYDKPDRLENQPNPLPASPAIQPPAQLAEVDDALTEKVDRLPPTREEVTKIEPVSLNRKAIRVNIDDVDLRVAQYAKSTIGQGNTPDAIAMIRQAIAARPQSAFLYRILGEAYAFQSDYDRSALALAQSIKLNKFDPLTSQVFSEVLTQLGQERRAEHYAQLSKDVANGLVTAN